MYYEFEDCDVKSKNKYFFDERKVGLNVESRNVEILTQHITTYIPFQVKFKMPKPDHGKRGYSDKMIDKIRSEVYGA